MFFVKIVMADSIRRPLNDDHNHFLYNFYLMKCSAIEQNISSCHIQTIYVRVDLVVMAMKEYSKFPKAPGLEPHHQMQFSFIPRTLTDVCVGGIASLKRYRRRILQPQPAQHQYKSLTNFCTS